MSTKRGIGYLLMIVGVALLIVQNFGSKINISLPESISKTAVLIISAIAIIIGFWLTLKGKPNSIEEVPIYSGEKIIGYRRH